MFYTREKCVLRQGRRSIVTTHVCLFAFMISEVICRTYFQSFFFHICTGKMIFFDEFILRSAQEAFSCSIVRSNAVNSISTAHAPWNSTFCAKNLLFYQRKFVICKRKFDWKAFIPIFAPWVKSRHMFLYIFFMVMPHIFCIFSCKKCFFSLSFFWNHIYTINLPIRRRKKHQLILFLLFIMGFSCSMHSDGRKRSFV